MSKPKKTAEETLQLIAQTLYIDPRDLRPSSSANDFDEWDSLGQMSILSMLESEFDLQLNPRDEKNLRSVSSILNYLREAGKLA